MSAPTPFGRATRNAPCAACRRPRSRRRSSRRCGTCCARPEIIARTWAAAKAEDVSPPEREVVKTVTDFAPLWDELFPAEQARIVRLLVERVDISPNGMQLRLRAEGLQTLIEQLRARMDEVKAA